MIVSPGFIDPVSFGSLSGYAIFEGAEGCGHTVYYFPISANKTLVVKNDFITIFSGSIDIEQGKEALKVPGVIGPQEANQIFKDILLSLKAD